MTFMEYCDKYNCQISKREEPETASYIYTFHYNDIDFKQSYTLRLHELPSRPINSLELEEIILSEVEYEFQRTLRSASRDFARGIEDLNGKCRDHRGLRATGMFIDDAIKINPEVFNKIQPNPIKIDHNKIIEKDLENFVNNLNKGFSTLRIGR